MSKYDEMRKELKRSIIDLDADHYRLDEFMRVIDEIFVKYRNEIEQHKIGGWIPCSERLPEKNGFCYPHVIAFAYEDNGWNMYIAVYDFYEDKKWRQVHGDMEEIYDVSYWMPLPKEPQHG